VGGSKTGREKGFLNFYSEKLFGSIWEFDFWFLNFWGKYVPYGRLHFAID
jgi:hypothetical protein